MARLGKGNGTDLPCLDYVPGCGVGESEPHSVQGSRPVRRSRSPAQSGPQGLHRLLGTPEVEIAPSAHDLH
jgi:hypothetical protein